MTALLGVGLSHAAVEPLNNLGEPFYSRTLQIEWKLRTNPLPASIKLYEVAPPGFFALAISNLLAPTGLSPNDQVAPLLFRKGDAYLTGDPKTGHLEFRTINRDKRFWPTNVPDEQRSFQLATNLTRLLGVPLSEFIAGTNGRPKSWFYPGTRGRFDKEKNDFLQAASTMGIGFRRQLDGLACFQECVHMQFESDEMLTILELDWHTLRPSSPQPTASTNDISKWIKEGRSRVRSIEVMGRGGRRLRPSQIHHLSIVEMDIHYTGPTFAKHDSRDRKPAKCLYPYAILTAEADLAPDDKELIYLFTPVTSAAVSSVNKAQRRYGFAIYPSRKNGP